VLPESALTPDCCATHDEPFQYSIAGSDPAYPTAVQASSDEQATETSELLPGLAVLIGFNDQGPGAAGTVVVVVAGEELVVVDRVASAL
jgi:hypothetical protein